MLVSPPTVASESAVVVLTWSVDPTNVSRPSNPAERFLFAHLYEPLVRVDCLGRLVPGLARSWTPVPSSTRWRLVLRDAARFSSGALVTAEDVVSSWRTSTAAPAGMAARRIAESASVVDDSTLEIECSNGRVEARATARGAKSEPQCASLTALGDPALAVIGRVQQGGWPDGTGAYTVRDVTAARAPVTPSRGSTIRLEPARSSSVPSLTVHSVSAPDARDRIDAGIDLLLTDDPALIAYASARPELSSIPLGWDRTWVVLTPGRAPNDGSVMQPDSIAARTLAFRAALARDAVRAAARGAAGPYWWSGLRHCSPRNTPATGPSTARSRSRVAFRRDEPIARAIAERMVALASGGGRDTALALLAPELLGAGPRLTTAALSPDEFESALRGGGELAYIVSLPRLSVAPCVDAERLLGAAPWAAADSAALDLSGVIAPLIDTRLLAAVRRDRLGLTVTGDGTVAVSTRAPTATGAPR